MTAIATKRSIDTGFLAKNLGRVHPNHYYRFKMAANLRTIHKHLECFFFQPNTANKSWLNLNNLDVFSYFHTYIDKKCRTINKRNVQCTCNGRSYFIKLFYCFTNRPNQFTRGFLPNDPNTLEMNYISQKIGGLICL